MLRVHRFALGILLLCFAVSTFAFQNDAGSTQKQDQPGSSSQQDAAANQNDNEQDAPQKQDSSAKRERQAEVSSSKDTRIDLSPPADDAKKHPQSGAAVTDAEDDNTDVQEFQKWDPHKAAKDIE